jgi:hypothetical protein
VARRPGNVTTARAGAPTDRLLETEPRHDLREDRVSIIAASRQASTLRPGAKS